jgi:hypothetical protein
MPEEIQTTVKVPIMEIVASLRKKHELPIKLTGVRLEGNNIVLNFASGGQEPVEIWKSTEIKRRKEPVGNAGLMDDNPMESVEPMSEDPMDIAEALNEEEPNENEEVMDEKPTETEQVTSEESDDDEKARERKRFWRK